MISGVYKITNTFNKKVYIGSSKSVEKRLKNHKKMLINKKHFNVHLQNAWNQNNIFIFETIEKVDNLQKLLEREQYWMDFYHSYDRNFGYNISPKSNRTEWSEETKLKASLSRIGKKRPEASGWHHTNDAKIKISRASKINRMGKRHSEETKIKIGLIRKNKNYEEIYGIENANRIKEAIRQFNFNRNYKTGFKRSKESIEKQSKSLRGKFQSKEKIEKCRIAKIGIKNPNYKIIPYSIKEKIVFLFVEKHMSRRQISLTLKYNQHIIKRVLIEEGVF